MGSSVITNPPSPDVIAFLGWRENEPASPKVPTYLLLNFAGKNPKKPSDFKSLEIFRNYCKEEFKKQFRKEASTFKDPDFEKILKKVGDEEIKKVFSVLFSTL